MKGIEENVDSKVDAMHEGRGRVRTSSQVFPKKDFVTKQLNSLSHTDDLRGALAKARGVELQTRNLKGKKESSIEKKIFEEGMGSKMATKSSECISLPTE